jgi:hypothetical protein
MGKANAPVPGEGQDKDLGAFEEPNGGRQGGKQEARGRRHEQVVEQQSYADG